MADTVIYVEQLAKSYHLGVQEQGSLRAALSAFTRRGVDKLRSSIRGNGHRPEPPLLWALKDVSFSVSRGEIVGIVGRNGAGKSTLLKILSRITHPTSGCAEIRGRVGALLEIGTGFHPELTGRENIYLSGAILGMRKRAIDRKFDEMVAFSELEKFLDTPVKQYSSGMYMRLAFAVAAHLDPDILFVDEVLAVGDFAFQKKCLGKIHAVAKEGRTVLFVSHNLSAISALTQRTLLLKGGRLVGDGPTERIVEDYLLSQESIALDDSANNVFRIRAVRVFGSEKRGNDPAAFLTTEGETITMEVDLTMLSAVKNAAFILRILDPRDYVVYSGSSSDSAPDAQIVPGDVTVKHRVRLPLAPGAYQVSLAVSSQGSGVIARAARLAHFQVLQKGAEQPGYDNRPGVIRVQGEWTIR